MYDETAFARKLAENLQVENHCRYITKEEFWEALPKVVCYLDEPLGDASAVALYFLSETASEKVKTVLSGEGADELLRRTYDSIGYLMKDSDQMQSIDLAYWLPGDILKKTDRMSMAHSLEIRVPFLDVYEMARRLPSRMKFRHGVTKYALRKAAQSVMPKQASNRRKLGVPIPIRNWLREEDWYLQVKEVFASETAAVYFHSEYLLKLLEEHRTGKEDHSRKIWTVYSFLLWYQIYFEKGAFNY